MSNMYNEILMEKYFEDGLELSTEQLAKALDLTVDALGTRSFPDCEFDGDPNHKILFTGYDIFSHEELKQRDYDTSWEITEEGILRYMYADGYILIFVYNKKL